MTLYKLNTDVIEIPDILIESEDLFDLKDLVAHKILVPITEQKCCDKCYSYTGGQVVYCVNLDCTCHKETLNPYDVKEEPAMTPKTNEQAVEETKFCVTYGTKYGNFTIHKNSCDECKNMTPKTNEQAVEEWEKEIKNILIKLTDVTGFDHSPTALESFALAEEELKSLLTRATAEAVEVERERAVALLKKLPLKGIDGDGYTKVKMHDLDDLLTSLTGERSLK